MLRERFRASLIRCIIRPLAAGCTLTGGDCFVTKAFLTELDQLDERLVQFLALGQTTSIIQSTRVLAGDLPLPSGWELSADRLNTLEEERRMPFDGAAEPFREPYRRRHASSKVQRALRGWRPIEHGERAWRWSRAAAVFFTACFHCACVIVRRRTRPAETCSR